ncbi:XrtN system VIT domain-containing protein [Flavobacterium difficile]|uniref:XrtN system VIT domain-containing protein n=1 Tax=Flavobacterium difficile TaxID=2709659 RepID=A0ABX0I174_9FLAO|nr:XrtN system VIT domain-containing protein [Flavobacterium difficile]NHM00948.1 XrtN system VIT domain-containing protein [Flavobacterium difficile]
METTEKTNYFYRQPGVKSSIVITILSTIMLIIALNSDENNFKMLEFFAFFTIVVELAFGVIVTYHVLKYKEKYKHLLPFLFLNWFIGCFSTNVFINIFENLPIWVYVTTFVFCFTNFAIYSNYKHKYASPLFYLINGSTFLLIIYYSVYLIPFAPYSFIGIIALGLGFYGIVPLIVTVVHVLTIIKAIPNQRPNLIAFSTGFILPSVSFIIFTVLLNNESKKINAFSTTNSFEETSIDLPTYIVISQNLNPNFFNEIILKKDLVYIASENFFEFRGFGDFGTKQYNERKTHNPIINLAYVFCEPLNISKDDRINILKSNFDKRLETEEQLWSGTDLFTKNIKEDVKIFADHRLAYTEITMDIACAEKTWGQKEAIYSFQLPEGAVATSLSLWVNGVERKGVLTTKEKAEKAYKQIVGVEARDPSLMQWKEGNRVVVRVFPISYELPRTFKCGFTTPLQVDKNKMIYESLDIKGPNINAAKTISRLQVVGSSTIKTSKNFELKEKFQINESIGLESWNAEMPLNVKTYSKSFVWKNKVYEINEIETTKSQFTPSEIILDLNSNWKLDEIESLLSNNNQKYYVIRDDEKQEINNQNYKIVFEKFENLSYSLLPFYNLKEKSLVVTKCGMMSANFEELATSKYLKKVKTTTKNKKIKVINISDNLNPFWQTVKEQKYITYAKMDLKNCINTIQTHSFPINKSAENLINIESANISIQENDLTTETEKNGNNHIFRMYAFNKVLEEQVKIQSDTTAQNQFVSLAKEANIVTPISSLLVLETDEDYEKNGIEKNVNTLGNASIKNDGAVPEPHEWALIFLALGMLFFYYKNQRKTA